MSVPTALEVRQKFIQALEGILSPDPRIRMVTIKNRLTHWFGMSHEELKDALSKSLTKNELNKIIIMYEHGGYPRRDAERSLAKEIGITVKELREILTSCPTDYLHNHPLYIAKFDDKINNNADLVTKKAEIPRIATPVAVNNIANVKYQATNKVIDSKPDEKMDKAYWYLSKIKDIMFRIFGLCGLLFFIWCIIWCISNWWFEDWIIIIVLVIVAIAYFHGLTQQ
jgi:hypothetical protein